MKIQTFVIGYVLALALFLFAQQRPEMAETTQAGGFREVVDLTHSLPTPGFESSQKAAYRTADRCHDREARSSEQRFLPQNSLLPAWMLPPVWCAACGR